MAKELQSAQSPAQKSQRHGSEAVSTITTKSASDQKTSENSQYNSTNRNPDANAYSDLAAAFEREIIRQMIRRKRLAHALVMSILVVLIVGGLDPIYTQLTTKEPNVEEPRALLEIKDALMPTVGPKYPVNEGVERIKSQAAANQSNYQKAKGERNPLFDMSTIHSSAVLLANQSTGDVILQKNQKLRVYPASLTKMMTVLLAIEHRAEIPERITMDIGIYPRLYRDNSSLAGFLPEEEVTVNDLIFGAMLASGGECCVALAVAISGTEEAFVELMNQRAKELGMLDTHFTNPTGLHDQEHFTTVRDLSILLHHALKNAEFQEVFKAEEYTTPPTNFRKDGRLLESGFFQRAAQLEFKGGRILGGKTGYTPEAGQCLATFAIKNDEIYIFISTGNNVTSSVDSYSIADALNAYENGIL